MYHETMDVREKFYTIYQSKVSLKFSSIRNEFVTVSIKNSNTRVRENTIILVL